MNWQKTAADFARAHDLLGDPATHALDLTSEVGEVAKEILKSTHYGRQKGAFGSRMRDELGDALYSLLVLAEVCQIDLGAALQAALDKYERRLEERGEAGS